jgi:hypothetical protein
MLLVAKMDASHGAVVAGKDHVRVHVAAHCSAAAHKAHYLDRKKRGGGDVLVVVLVVLVVVAAPVVTMAVVLTK